MLSPCRFDIAQVSLRADPIEKGRFSGLVAQSCRLECLACLRDKLVAEEFDVMMRRLDFFQLIAQEPQRFLLFAVETLFRGADVLASFANSSGIFYGIHPGHGERNSGIQFADRLRRIVVALSFHHQRWVRDPGAARELKL